MIVETARPLWREFDGKFTKGRPLHFSDDDGGAHEPYIKQWIEVGLCNIRIHTPPETLQHF